MATAKKDKPLERTPSSSHTIGECIGEYAHRVIEEQYHRVIKQEKRVLADSDPEPLHQMRVGTRRLRTALQVFETAIELPKAASANRLRDLARILGAVRDLDVQLASLKEDYYPNLSKREQKSLDRVINALNERRKKAFAKMEEALTHPSYEALKTAYKTWLNQPQYKPIAQLPLFVVLPDLLSPLLAHLLLHPAWLISIDQVSNENSATLHDLRKACKHARYQAEFFTPFYGQEFHDWIEEVKQLQEQLGAFQDIQVLLDLITDELGEEAHLPDLHALIEQKQTEALSQWEQTRQKYLKKDFRYHLHQLMLQPATEKASPT